MSDTEKIVYQTDIAPSGAVQGNIVVYGSPGKLRDGGKSISDLFSKVEGEAVQDAIQNEHAIAAYSSDEWAPGQSYAKGDYCMFGTSGYICVESHVSGSSFSSSKWSRVLSEKGKIAIDKLLERVEPSSNGTFARDESTGLFYKVFVERSEDGLYTLSVNQTPSEVPIGQDDLYVGDKQGLMHKITIEQSDDGIYMLAVDQEGIQ